MTSAVNLEFRNISISSLGTETIDQLCKSSPFLPSKSGATGCPFLPHGKSKEFTTTSMTSDEEREEHQRHSSDGTIQTLARKKRSRMGHVRFSPSTSYEKPVGHQNKTRKWGHKKEFDSSDSIFWWTKEELRGIQQSCIFAVLRYESGFPLISETSSSSSSSIDGNDSSLLERYSSRNRKRRKLVRYQMKETVRAVKEFESATKIETPPEMLSQLLQRYSASTAEEANNRALRTALSCAALNSSSRTTERTAISYVSDVDSD
eukprot:CAMPEP_0168223406 /NCGR_PEP_ID=MMETSP0140_2-20121125/11325_1 /TAXON_ID=44445 /ORGANISM="Pseudo-nitzschia australis, Strain 10249 10 AB" /LENGTH=261 /DNA_ID=CAMNT_0008153349 /DNA_START=135 /DNA_END=920 /DNA_ORIENTATION=+